MPFTSGHQDSPKSARVSCQSHAARPSSGCFRRSKWHKLILNMAPNSPFSHRGSECKQLLHTKYGFNISIRGGVREFSLYRLGNQIKGQGSRCARSQERASRARGQECGRGRAAHGSFLSVAQAAQEPLFLCFAESHAYALRGCQEFTGNVPGWL